MRTISSKLVGTFESSPLVNVASVANFDNVLKRNTRRVSCGVVGGDLHLSGIKSHGVTVSRNSSSGSYVITFSSKRTMSSKMLVSLLSQENEDAVFYDEDIDEDPLIHMSEKPIWAVSKKGNTFTITRNTKL